MPDDTIRIRKRPPTVVQLLRLLNKVRVKCINYFPDKSQRGEWRPLPETDGDIGGTVVVATKADPQRGVDGLISVGLHELTHAFFQINCQDDRVHHNRIYRWEGLIFKSRALREAMAVRIANSYIFGVEDP